MKKELHGEAEVSVTFMTDEEIQKMNNEYRGIDQPTDVISFALEEMSEGEIAIIAQEGYADVLGDIIISVERQSDKQKNMGMTLNEKLVFWHCMVFLHFLATTI